MHYETLSDHFPAGPKLPTVVKTRDTYFGNKEP